MCEQQCKKCFLNRPDSGVCEETVHFIECVYFTISKTAA
uniref:Uncharacterized protein n=1 Tax=Anguilla anguilla TaxID=7936 RepID=A0A0E9T4V2_ANGAN